jgi:hypothetical protein
VGRDSSVGIATSYGLDGPGIETRWGRDFLHLSRPALGPTQLRVQWVPGLSRGKERPERDADPSPLSSAIDHESRAIPLLPLWAVRPVQSLSACTRVHFYLFYLLYVPGMFIRDLMRLYDKLVCDTTIWSSTSVSCSHATLAVHGTTDVGVPGVEGQVTVNIKVRLCFMELTGLKVL